MSLPRQTNLLEVEDLLVCYGGVAAVRGLSLSVGSGEVVSVIGPNGAGKSTLLTAIAGGLAAERGSIRFSGQEILGRRADEIARLGISFVPEGRHVFSTLTVEENLTVATCARPDRTNIAGELADLFRLFPPLQDRRRTPAGRLSGGEQQMLAIGRAMLARPKLIMVDEPSLGLAPRIVDRVYEVLLSLRQRQGLTLLIVEQSSHRILKHADRIYVLRDGCIQMQDLAANLQDGRAIKQAYFGFRSATNQASPVTTGIEMAHD
jgi:branched-chain amino acid transport system ATP-binding protein